MSELAGMFLLELNNELLGLPCVPALVPNLFDQCALLVEATLTGVNAPLRVRQVSP